MIKPVTLPVFFHTDNTTDLKGMGLKYSLDDCDVRPMRFYSMIGIAPFAGHTKTYTAIYTAGGIYVCTKPMKEVQSIIEAE